MPNVPVQILLSTWNGEHWLPELLESLRQQTFQQWQLLVRDDGSTDQTLRILLEYQGMSFKTGKQNCEKGTRRTTVVAPTLAATKSPLSVPVQSGERGLSANQMPDRSGWLTF